MRIQLSVRTGARSTRARPIAITTPPGCPSEELTSGRIAALLARTLGVPGDALVVGTGIVAETTVLGSPPLLTGTSVRLVERARWSPPARAARTATTEIAVIGGPDAGHAVPLTAGSHSVGRTGATLTIADPTLSRFHARVDVTPTGLALVDLGSENGTVVDGARLRGGQRALSVGSVITMGRTTLTIRPSRIVPLATSPHGDGTLSASRSVAALPPGPGATITVPSPPEQPSRRRVPWIAALLPVPVAVLLAWFLGPHFLLLGLMSPLLVLGNVVSDRLGARRTYAEDSRRHHLAVARCEEQRETALAEERHWRTVTFPDPAAIARIAGTPGAGLWGREARPGSPLPVRIGAGETGSGVVWIEAGVTTHLALPAAPVILDLGRVGSLSIVGDLAGAVADNLIGQLVTLYSPTDLRILTDRSAWAPAPHVRSAPAPQALREAAAAEASGDGGLIVLIVSATDLDSPDLTVLSALSRAEPGRGVVVLTTDDRVTATRAMLRTSRARDSHLIIDGAAAQLVCVDGVSAAWVARVARSLAPLRDAESGSALPDAVSLSTALERQGGHALTSEQISRRWADADDGAWVTLGTGAEGTVRLDLASAGPHTLVGGTTGSGKSELLRTIVTSLAAEHCPEDAAVVLVDYKGGSAFAGLERLPHIVGLVTDLDPALTRRALRSLRAEIHRREELLARAGVSDITGYRRRSRAPDGGLPHLHRLVIVVDEFRALADELPDFVTGLVHLAAVGRSLGLHLVLATQRPAGVVTADMRANLNLRIALRVRDRGDSLDVIETDDASRIPRHLPGRALVRCGSEDLTAVQVATVAGSDRAGAITIEVGWSDGTVTARDHAVDTPATSDLVTLIAAAAQGHTAPVPPWLPPLPTSRSLEINDPAAAWCLEDDPDAQRQELVALTLPGLPLTAVCGSVGSGRTTTTVAMSLAALAGTPDTHVYVLADPSGALAALAQLPQTGAVIDRADPATVGFLVDRLSTEVRNRQRQSAQDDGVCATYLLVVIDGWDVLADACDELDHGALTDRLLAVLREGFAVGVRAVVTGDRSVLTGRLSRTFQNRLLLRPADDTDVLLCGVRTRDLPGQWPTGRLIRADGRQGQVVLRGVGDRPVGAPARPPWRVVALPSRVPLADLDPRSPQHLPIAVTAGDEVVLVGGPGRRRVLVLGSGGSGRSTALATIAVQAQRAGRVVCALTDAPDDLGALTAGAAEPVGWADAERLIELRRAHPDLVVVADDVGRHADAPTVAILEQIADLVERDGGLIALAGESAGIGLRTRGAGAAVSRGRTALILGRSTTADGDLVGARLPRSRDVVPGRGWLVADRQVTPVQLAVTPVTSSATTAPLAVTAVRSARDEPSSRQ